MRLLSLLLPLAALTLASCTQSECKTEQTAKQPIPAATLEKLQQEADAKAKKRAEVVMSRSMEALVRHTPRLIGPGNVTYKWASRQEEDEAFLQEGMCQFRAFLSAWERGTETTTQQIAEDYRKCWMTYFKNSPWPAHKNLRLELAGMEPDR